MPLTYSALKSPVGEIDYVVWFPGKITADVDTLLTGYLTDAYTRTDNDDAAALWAYYRAATAVADSKSNIAGLTASLADQGGATIPASGWQYWVAKAAGYLADFNVQVEAVAAATVSPWPDITSLRRVG